jgi:hypothetical protein
MREIKAVVYSVDELNEKAFKKAYEDWKESLDYHNELKEYITEQLKELLAENLYEVHGDLKVHYSLSHSQGDGAGFEGTVMCDGYKIEIKHKGGHYYHYNSYWFTFYRQLEEDAGDEWTEVKDNDAIIDDLKSIMRKLEKEGYSFIEGQEHEKTFKEQAKDLEFEFWENGRRYN